MKKVFVKVDYQVITGGAVVPTRIHWHDGRTWDIVKTLHACTLNVILKEFATRYLLVARKNIYTELATHGMSSQFKRRWTQVEKLHFIR